MVLYSMLNLKICLVDFAEVNYQSNSVYTQTLSRSQLNLLYLGQALAVRPNRISIMSERSNMFSAQGIDYLAFPEDPAAFWSEAAFDVVICLDSLQATHLLKPYLPVHCQLILWTHLPPEHLAMLPLKATAVQNMFAAIICETQNLHQSYIEIFQLPSEKMFFFAPSVVRSLRKRFATTHELSQLRHKNLTLGFMAPPEEGLAELLAIFTTLQAGFSDLQLQIMLPPEFEAPAESVQTLLTECMQRPGIVVKEPRPWPSHIEDLLQCHLIAQPITCPHNEVLRLINALGAGCQVVSAEHAALQDVCGSAIQWVTLDPKETYLQRFAQTLAHCLETEVKQPHDSLDQALERVANIQTRLTWDLRVWEWESVLYHLTKPKHLAQ